MLERAEDAVTIIKGAVDKDSLRKQRILQCRRNRVHRSRAPLAHAFRAAVAVGRRCSRVPVLNVRNIHGGDRSVIAESAGHHVAYGIIDAGFHQRRADTVSRGAIDLPFHDRRIDDCAAIVDGHVVENLRDKSIGVDFDDRNVQLRGVGQRETAVFRFGVGNLERCAPYVAAVEGDIIQFGREHGAIHVHNVCEAPVVDGFPCALCPYFGPLRTDSEFEIVFSRFERNGGEALHFGFEFLCRAVNRRQTGDRELTGVGSGEAGVDVALRVEPGTHGDHVGMNVEYVGDDLRRSGFVPLALRTRTDGHNHFAVNIEFAVCALRVAGERRVGVNDLRLAEVVGSGIECGADANADHAAVLFFTRLTLLLPPIVPADKVLRDFEHLRIVAGVVHAAVGRGVRKLFRTDVVAQAHFVRCDADLVGADVDDALQEPEVLHARVSAIGAYGTFVGDRLPEIDASVLETIYTTENLRPDHAAQRLIARVGTAVVDMARVDGGDDTLFVEGDARVSKSALVAVSARNHVLGAGFDPLDGPPTGLFRRQSADGHLRVTRNLDAEAASDVESLNPDLIDMNVQVRGQELDRE